MVNTEITPDANEDEIKVFIRPFKVGKSEKYGLFDIKGNFIIEPKFDYAHDFNEGLAAVEIDCKCGYINIKGEWSIEPKFDNAQDFHEGLAAVRIDYKWGFINTKGEWVIEPKFDLAYEFKDGIANVEIDGKRGYINTKGEWIVEPKFDSASEFIDGIAQVKIDGKYGYINTKGEWIIEPKFNDLGNFYEGLASVRIDGKNGCINYKGETVIEPKFDRTLRFSEGLSVARIDGKCGYINPKGEFVIGPKYYGAHSFSDGLAAVSIETDKWGYINTKGDWVIEPEFDFAYDFSEGLAYVGKRVKAGFINAKGEITTCLKFGFINTKGEKVTILKFDPAEYSLDRYFKNGLVVVYYNHKCGVLNTKGEWLIEPVCDRCSILEDGLIQIEIGKKTGYTNTKGEWVIRPYTVKKAKQQTNQSETSPRIRMRKIKIELYGRGCQINTYHLKGFPGENYRAMRDGEYSEIIVHDGKKETAYSTADLGENLVLEERPRDKNLNCYLLESKRNFSRIVQIELKGHAFINIKIPKDETFDPKKLHFIYGEFVLPDGKLEVNTGAVYAGTQYKIEIDPDSAYGTGKTIWKADKN